MDTGRGISHTGACGVGDKGKNSRGWGDWRGIALEEIPNVDDRAMDAANHYHGMCIHMCNLHMYPRT